MNREFPATSFAILGLLAKGPRSGYSLAAFADRSIAHFWPISRTLVYRELTRLEGLGFLQATEVSQERRPDKRVYAITDTGQQALNQWLEEPTFDAGSFRSRFLLKFFFAERMSAERARRLLNDYRTATEAALEDLTAIAARLERIPAARFPRLTALHGVRTARARLQWIQDIEADLEREIDQTVAVNHERPPVGEESRE